MWLIKNKGEIDMQKEKTNPNKNETKYTPREEMGEIFYMGNKSSNY